MNDASNNTGTTPTRSNKTPLLSNTETIQGSADIVKYLEALGKVGLTATAALYIFGFLTINSHLSKFGYFDYDVASPRLLLAGGLCAAYILSWYLFSGRSIIHGKTWLSEDIAIMKNAGAGRIWEFILFTNSIVKIIFLTCLSATSFGFIIFDSPSQSIFIGVMSLLFIVSYTIDVTDIDLSHPRTAAIIEMTIKFIGIFIFSISAYIDHRLAILFFSFLGMSVYANMVYDSFERRGATRDRIIFTAIHSTIFLLTTFVFFGQQLYGEIRSRIGGGYPVPVQLILSEKINIPGTYKETDVISGDLIYASSKSTLINVDKSSIIIQSDKIKIVKLTAINEKNWIENMKFSFDKLGITIPEAWKTSN